MIKLQAQMMVRFVILCLLLLGNTTSSLAQNFIFAELQGQPLMNTSGWTLTGAAGIGDTNGDVDTFSNELILTHNINNSSGGIFYSQALDLAICQRWIASFEFRIWDGNAADGIAFCFLDVPPAGFVGGGGIGIPATANGLKVVFDTYDNGCGPNPEIQVYSGPGYDECFPTLVKLTNLGGALNFIRSNSYNAVEIHYDSGFVDVFVNGNLMLGNVFAPAAFTGYVGFTSGTGAQNDRHSIRNVSIYTDGTSLSGFLGLDTTGRWPAISASCYADTLRLKTIGQFRCSTVDPRGSEFRLYDPQGFLIQIMGVTTQCINDRSDELLLQLGQPFLKNGRHFLVLRQGIDGDVILGDCGAALEAFDTLYIDVSGCYIYNSPLPMRNVSVLPDNRSMQLHWAFPANLDSQFFNGYRLQRNTTAGSTLWSDVFSFSNIIDTVFVYNQLNPELERADFRVILQVKFNPDCPPGDSIANILLENPDGALLDPDATFAGLSWTSHEQAWPNPIYRVVLQDENGDTSLSDVLLQTTYQLELPTKRGDYQVYVSSLADDERYSRSNYLAFNIPERLPEVSNVITPNGDGLNDVLFIRDIQFFPDAEVQLFNRWGQLVFQTLNYINDWSPTALSAGTYLYRVRLADGHELNGALRIVK